MSQPNPYTTWGGSWDEGSFDDDSNGSAFGVADVRWETGDDDLTVPAPPPAAPAPRPAAPLTGDTQVPEWARIAPTTPPPSPSYTSPQGPLTPQPPAPGVPQRIPQASLPRPDLETPEWARIQPDSLPAFGAVDEDDLALPGRHSRGDGFDDGFDNEGYGGTPNPPVSAAPVSPLPAAVPAAAMDPAVTDKPIKKLFGIPLPPAWQTDAPPPKKDKGRKRKDKGAASAARTSSSPKRGNPAAGGRWKVRLFRVIAWCVCAVLLIGGIRNIVKPHKDPSIHLLSKQVAKKLGQTPYPIATAEGFAARFAQLYLTYDSNDTSENREAELARYGSAQMLDNTGWEGSGVQRVLDGPFVAESPTIIDAKNAIITVTAEITGNRWVYLSVPVYAASASTMAVSGPPAFGPAPAIAKSPGIDPEGNIQNDDALAESLETNTLPGFFTAWAASDGTALQRYLTPTATPAAHAGLGGQLTYSDVTNIYVPQGGDTRKVFVDVEWNAAAAGKYVQSYSLTLHKLSNGQWYVADIVPSFVAGNQGPLTSLTGTGS